MRRLYIFAYFDSQKRAVHEGPNAQLQPTLSLGISRIFEPCFRKTAPDVCDGLMPTPSSVMIALVASFCLNSLHTKEITAVNGASSGTFIVLNGRLGSEVSVILNWTYKRAASGTIE